MMIGAVSVPDHTDASKAVPANILVRRGTCQCRTLPSQNSMAEDGHGFPPGSTPQRRYNALGQWGLHTVVPLDKWHR